MTSPMQTDTMQITTIDEPISQAGVLEGELLTKVMRAFPNVTIAELSAALQVVTAAAEKQALRRH